MQCIAWCTVQQVSSSLGPASLGQYLGQLEGGVSLPALVLTPAQLPPGTDQDTVQIFAEMYKQVIPYFCTSN